MFLMSHFVRQKSTVEFTFHFLHKLRLEMAFERHRSAKNGENSEKDPQSISDIAIEIFKVTGVCGNFFHIQRVKLHINTLSNFHDK